MAVPSKWIKDKSKYEKPYSVKSEWKAVKSEKTFQFNKNTKEMSGEEKEYRTKWRRSKDSMKERMKKMK